MQNLPSIDEYWRNNTIPLKDTSDNSARNGAGTETRPFLSILLICVDKNNAMRVVQTPTVRKRISCAFKRDTLHICLIMEKHGYIWNNMG